MGRSARITPRERYLLKTYGITEKQYNEVLRNQNGGCAVCDKRTATRAGARLHVDHDHTTGEIRGLLCYVCNHKLIGRNRHPEAYIRAGRYLTPPFTGWFVPVKKKKRKTSARKNNSRRH
jgi:hypothetical protein